MPKKKNKILISGNGIRLAPCSFCDRKPGFFCNGKNYCWIHWDEEVLKKKKMENLN
tara:strand:+ start:544 stop:711 length:168 start_codon:yes stop_codon:yes gene_type:complete